MLPRGDILETQQVLELLKIRELQEFDRATRAKISSTGQVDLDLVEQRIIDKYGSYTTFAQKFQECQTKKPCKPSLRRTLTMTSLKRRQFLQFAGATLSAIGLSQIDFLHQADRHGKVLAQGSSERKLALLVGITYGGNIALPGCLTDLELQWHLLVHRFGFNPKDILVLADQQPNFLATKPSLPTRQNILDAFNQHLIQQAKPGDTVVFHYSGHGALVADDRSKTRLFTQNNRTVDGTIVPLDHLPDANSSYVRDIMGRSLFLLTDSLKTDNVTVILDSCHSGAGTRGGSLVYRNIDRRTNQPVDPPSPEELQYQDKLLRDKQLTEAEFAKRREKIAKGIAIGSANYLQLAADASYDNDRFRAGAFTYLLTRYLWQVPTDEPIDRMFDKLRLATAISASDQIPEHLVNPALNEKRPIYFVNAQTPWADAVIRKVPAQGEDIEFWLGGISAISLEQNSKGSIYSVIDAQQKEIAQITQTRREGLRGYGVLSQGSKDAIKPGAMLREMIQGIDPNPVLRVAVDESLGNDAAAVKSALERLSFIKLVPIAQASYMIGRMTAQYRQQSKQQKASFIPDENQIGLFTGSGLRPVESSFQSGEAIAAMVDRLRPNLKSLLAAQILRTITGGDVAVASRNPNLSIETKIVTLQGEALGGIEIKRFKAKSEVQLELSNRDQQNLYVAAIAVNSDGTLSFLHPASTDAPESAALLEKGKSLTTATVTLNPPAGFVEVLTIVSAKPIRKALLALQRIAAQKPTASRSPILVSNDDSLNVIGDLLGDLDHNTRASATVNRDVSGVNKTQFSAVSTIVEVVE